MNISLTPEQRATLNEYVAQGDFPSVEEAARRLIDERIAERAAEAGEDLAWAKPLLDTALADMAAGRLVSFDEHEARMGALTAAMTV